MKLGAALTVVLALAACSSGSHKPPAAFPNPVTVITNAGCTPAPGVVNGQLGTAGDFMVATCDFPSGETITVKTFKTAAAKASELGAGGPAQDGVGVVVGPDWVAYVYAPHDASTGGYDFTPSVDDVARTTGGVAQ